MAWDYPVFIVAMFVAAVGVASWLIRAAGPQRVKASFSCAVCGRSVRAASAREWRYCPYCGAPRSARSTRELPRMRRSVVDL